MLQFKIKFIIFQQERDYLKIDWIIKIKTNALHVIDEGMLILLPGIPLAPPRAQIVIKIFIFYSV